MRLSAFLLASLFGLLTVLAQAAPEKPVAPKAATRFEIKDGAFRLDGKPFQIISGEIHYPRVPKAYWRHRLQMAKACGLNTITTYVFWNVHEPEKGKFTFRGEADIAEFVRIAKQEGLYVILRPGPYVCAEWEFGGLPYWLLNEKDLVVRTRSDHFIRYTERFFAALAREVAPLQITHGGNILLVQVENEYGSYGDDKIYMGRIKDAVQKAGFDVPYFTCDGGSQMPAGSLPGILPGYNGGSGPEIRKTIDAFFPGGPYFVPEYYPGWLDHWGEPKSRVSTDSVVRNTERMLQNNISFNYYMFHGGTNFGFLNGANFGGNFQPQPTSYDYDAPLDEAGRATLKYRRLRETIAKSLPAGTKLPSIPAENPIIAVPRFSLPEVGSLDGILPKPLLSENVRSMEEIGQDYGYVLYRTTVEGPFAGRLTLKDVRDYAVVLLNGKRVGLLDRRRGQKAVAVELPAGKAVLDILVENGGRINFGPLLTDNKKGLTQSARLGEKELKGWEIFSLPFRDVSRLRWDGKATDGPTFRRGVFTLTEMGDTFLDMRGWTKGVVWVNGHNLGRFWNIGPPQTLYVPAPWLKKGRNEIVALELVPGGQTSVEGLKEPVLDDLRPEGPLRTPRPLPSVRPVPANGTQIVEGAFNDGDAPQDVTFGPQKGRYLCLEARDSFDGDYASGAELFLLDKAGKPLSRDKWSVYYASSEETAQEDGAADNLLDDDTATIWHSVWSKEHPPLPQFVVIDLGQETEFAGVRYLARPGKKPAKLRRFALYVSNNGFRP